MNPTDAGAIADYLSDGGQIVKVQATIPATEGEILAYLGAHGGVRYQHGDAKPYIHNGKRFSIEGLVRLANDYRQAEQLPPFALRVDTLSYLR